MAAESTLFVDDAELVEEGRSLSEKEVVLRADDDGDNVVWLCIWLDKHRFLEVGKEEEKIPGQFIVSCSLLSC